MPSKTTYGTPSKLASMSSGKSAGLTYQERFIENRGQWDSEARFMGKSPGMDTWITETGVVYDIFRLRELNEPNNGPQIAKRSAPHYAKTGQVVRMGFAGGQPGTAQGQDAAPGKVGYILPNSGGGIATEAYSEAKVSGIYDGINLRMYFDNGSPRYDLIVLPGVDPSQIKLQFDGANSVKAVSGTTLEIGTNAGTLRMDGLYAYQMYGQAQVSVPASFSVSKAGTVSFVLGAYDRNKPLVIDPVVYSTLMGGTGSVDVMNDIAIDALGQAYVCGYATSATYPTSIGAYDETMVLSDGVVSKLLPDGSDLVFSTYIGGSGDDECWGIAIDATNNVYVCGQTTSANLDTSAGAFQTARQNAPAGPNFTPEDPLIPRLFADNADAFVAKLNPSGTARTWMTYLGGNRRDWARSVAVDSTGAVYVTGMTQSTSVNTPDNGFPFAAVPFPTTGGAIQTTMRGDGDAFLTKLNSTGTALVYSTFLGGTDTITPSAGPGTPWDDDLTHGDDDIGVSVKVDIDFFAYVCVQTSFTDAPTTPGSFDTIANGLDALVLKVATDGQSLSFGTFIGGNFSDQATDMDIDATGNVFITGPTNSFNYPRTVGAYDTTYNLGTDAFVTKLNRLGTGLVYSTFIGSNTTAVPWSIKVDDLNFAHIGGAVWQANTNTVQIPLTGAADQTVYNGPTNPLISPNGDAFLEVFNPTGSGLLYCSYWGGAGRESCNAIAVDGARNDYIAGWTTSATNVNPAFPTTPGAFKEAFPLDAIGEALPDGFVAKIKTRIPYTITGVTVTPNPIAGGNTATGTVTISAPASDAAVLVTITNDNNSIVTTPASALIPVGASSVDFTVQTSVNVSQDTTVKITCTIEGDSKFASLLVRPLFQALTLSNDTVVGGNPVGARVTLNFPAGPSGVTIGLTSSIPSLAQVPASVTVPAGELTAIFDVNTVGVSAPQSVDITAGFGGVLRTKTLTVIPARLFALSFAPNVLTGGLTTTGIVQLDGNAPNGGVVVALSSSDPAVQVPATVTITGQTQSASFSAPTQIVAINTSVTVTATLGADNRSAVVDVLYASLTSLGLAPDSLVGGNNSTGTVGLDRPATGAGVPIALSSNNPAVAAVPATVTIPAGAAFVNFTVTTARVSAITNVTITATRGSVVLNAVLQVRPMTFTMSIAPASMPGGNSATGTVTLIEAAPPGGIVVALSSNNAAATVPASITIPVGATTGTFTVSSVPVAVNTLVTITGDYFVGAVLTHTATANVNITAPTATNLTIAPSTVAGGQSATGTLTVSGPAPTGGLTATLSSNSGAAVVPASVTVPQGTTTASFQITTNAVAATTVATITATVNASNRQATLTILKASLTGISFDPSRVRGGFQTTQMTITLDAAAPPAGATVNLSQTNPNVANIPATVQVLPGQTSRTVTITTKRVSRTLTTLVTANYGGDEVSAALTATR
ncbi:MAG: SBBP repeat-containing protein [Fimbriimonadaceae bacterium]|nr:SBBP repeat-containing protein [Fimbriimonadaceae bacterium]